MRRDYAESLECTVIIRDIAERNNIRDIPLLDVLFAWAVKTHQVSFQYRVLSAI